MELLWKAICVFFGLVLILIGLVMALSNGYLVAGAAGALGGIMAMPFMGSVNEKILKGKLPGWARAILFVGAFALVGGQANKDNEAACSKGEVQKCVGVAKDNFGDKDFAKTINALKRACDAGAKSLCVLAQEIEANAENLQSLNAGSYGSLGKGKYMDLERQYLAWNELNAKAGAAFLYLDAPNEKFLEVPFIKSYCVDTGLTKDACLSRIDEFKRVRSALIIQEEFPKKLKEASEKLKHESDAKRLGY